MTSTDQATGRPLVHALKGAWRWSAVHNGARAILLPLLAAVFAAVLFAIYAHSQRAGGEWLEQTAVVAGLVFGATLLIRWGVRHTCRKVFHDLALHVTTLRENPSAPQPSS